MLLCSKQDIALRDHRESVESANRGNFLEILQLLAKHDPIVRHRISCGPKNATYTSPDIQNALLKVMGNLVRKRICAEVQKAGMYSILADETKDCSKREQLAIVLRYVDAESGSRTLRLNDSNLSTFDSILATLEVIKDGDDRPKAVEAIGILTQVRCFRFLLQLLIIFWRILSCTKSLSDQLKSTTIDMARAADLAEATIETFEEFRTDAAWEHLFQYSQDVD